MKNKQRTMQEAAATALAVFLAYLFGLADRSNFYEGGASVCSDSRAYLFCTIYDMDIAGTAHGAAAGNQAVPLHCRAPYDILAIYPHPQAGICSITGRDMRLLVSLLSATAVHSCNGILGGTDHRKDRRRRTRCQSENALDWERGASFARAYKRFASICIPLSRRYTAGSVE